MKLEFLRRGLYSDTTRNDLKYYYKDFTIGGYNYKWFPLEGYYLGIRLIL